MKLLGNVDALNEAEIVGWATDQESLESQLLVDVIINDEVVATLKAGIYRGDLESAGLGDGRKAFSFTPKPYLGNAANEVRICFSGTDQLLPNGQATILNSSFIESAGESRGSPDFEALFSVSQERWKGDEEDANLTWGRLMTGDSFIDVAELYHGFSKEDLILEIGPGYGRLLKTILERKLPFKRFVGVELSKNRVERLNQDLGNDRIQFEQGDVFTYQHPEPFSVMICSSTFEHLFPEFSRALENLKEFSRPGAKFFVDFVMADEALETSSQGFETDGGAFVHVYSEIELKAMFGACGYGVLGIEKVVLGRNFHKEEIKRALVIAELGSHDR